MKKSLAAIIVALLSAMAFFAVTAREGDTTQYVFTGQEDHSITLNDAARYVQRYSQDGDQNQPNAEYFGADALLEILAQDGCVGVRSYYGINDEGRNVMVFVGVDGSGDDILAGVMKEKGLPCPPWCGEEGAQTLTNYQ